MDARMSPAATMGRGRTEERGATSSSLDLPIPYQVPLRGSLVGSGGEDMGPTLARSSPASLQPETRAHHPSEG